MAPKNDKPKSAKPARNQFSGTYGFRLQGWLRATNNTNGDFHHSGRPQIEQPVVVAGFQSPAGPPPADITRPLPAQTINSGYYPYALLGEITYHHGGSISGFHRLSLGGNNDGTEHAITGNYQLNGSDGTYTIIDTVSGESVSYAFVLVDGDKEIEFMDISSKPNTASTVSATATGVQKRI